MVGTLWSVDDRLCVDMARMTYEFLGEERVTDAAVSSGRHHATRTLRDQWVNNQSTALKELRVRNASLCENEDLRMPPWVPYVRYGV